MAAAERFGALAAAVERAVADVDVIAGRTAQAAQRVAQSPGDELVVYGAGALLHGFYTEVEKAFQRIARDLDGFAPRGESWHAELLTDMSLDVPAVRPPVISAALQRRLRPYLRFRHLFRNLYVLDLDGQRTCSLLQEVPAVWAEARAALLEFVAALRTMAPALRGD
ncbi:MAG: hypothetical protein HY744_13990 [Deltaproteobacteria bacterium]|nr:hypothetical protein [Deltaproteobacteria bacterium]